MSCPVFEVAVHTSPGPNSGTFSRLWLSLIGSQGETPPIRVNDQQHLLPGSVSASELPTQIRNMEENQREKENVADCSHNIYVEIEIKFRRTLICI